MIKNILLPTDFSDNSWNAIVYAVKLYANETCKFYLLNSTKDKLRSRNHITTNFVDTLREDALKELLDIKDQAEMANANASHEFEIIISSEDLKTAIKSAINDYEIDLIVMGTKGATGAKEFFFGSNTVSVMNKIRFCPILVIPEYYDFVEPKQIAFPTDYNRFYDSIELRPLKDLAELYNSKIRIVHINEEKKLDKLQEYNLTMLQEYLKNYEHSFHWMPDYAKKTEEINTFIKDLEIDMLAMVHYEHSLIERIVKEPVIKNIGFHPIVPFLVIPE